jgi:hypothetical protein
MYIILLQTERQMSDQLGVRQHADKLCFRPSVYSSHTLTKVQIAQHGSFHQDLHKKNEAILVKIKMPNYTNICNCGP